MSEYKKRKLHVAIAGVSAVLIVGPASLALGWADILQDTAT